jgi:maleate isomerase
VRASELERMVREVAAQGCDAAMIFCTNLDGAETAARLEPELGIPIYDSVAVTLWKCLQMSGVAPSNVRGWGQLFERLD